MTTLTVLAFSDLHGNKNALTAISDELNQHTYDLCLVAGDLTHFGDADDARETIEQLNATGTPLCFIHGNCDPESTRNVYEKHPGYVHNQTRQLQECLWGGYGNVPVTPFGTHNEVDETVIEQDLIELLSARPTREAQHLCLITHSPPYGLNDLTPTGQHAGSKALRTICDTYQPALMLSGHIHEAAGITVYNYATKTIAQQFAFDSNTKNFHVKQEPHHGIFLNVAAARNGHFVSLQLDETHVLVHRW
ncbi:MAG TPA: metallophosphoesterase [bacterium]|nr:metallophosphoesterase [bacterium]